MTTSPVLAEAMQLVDEVIDCRAQLDGCASPRRRAELESAISVRAHRIQLYLEALDDQH
jgi:hypothetical protein